MDNRLRILMLEDMLTDAELIERELSRGGLAFETMRAETREEFESALDGFAPGLILADYSLPSFDARLALQIVSEQAPGVPFILVSGALGDELAVETLKSGATDYVLKNNLSRLVPSVRRALREAEERAERRRAEEEIRRLNEDLERRVTERTAQLKEANLVLESEIAERLRAEEEKARLYEQAREAVRARETLLSVVSHDLRNLLMAVNGSVKLLQWQLASGSGSVDVPLMQRGLERVGAAATRMNGLISELLDFARLEAGQSLDLYPRSTDLVALSRQVAAEHQQTSNRHSVRVEAAEQQLVGLWDTPRLERVLDNLVSNAIKYSPVGGEITVRVSREERDDGADLAVVEVRDQGIGIPAEDLPFVFEWFRRAGNVAGRISGTGIGLASARQVVEQHGGTIGIQSEEGRGSTVTVCLPLTPASG